MLENKKNAYDLEIEELVKRTEIAYKECYEVYDKTWNSDKKEDNDLLVKKRETYYSLRDVLASRAGYIALCFVQQLKALVEGNQNDADTFESVLISCKNLPTPVRRFIFTELLKTFSTSKGISECLDSSIARRKAKGRRDFD